MTAALLTTTPPIVRSRRHRACPEPNDRREDRCGIRRRPVVYRRRRVVAALVVSGVLSTLGLVAQGVLTGPGGDPASAAGTGTAPPLLHVRAESGDSLWSIAERFHGDIDLSRYVDALIEVNGGTSIAAGQLVRLP